MRDADGFWNGFVSNTVAGTGNNFVLFLNTNRTYTYRSYIKPLYAGLHTWKFWYSNTVDSTFADGAEAYAGRPGGSWTVQRAAVGIAMTADGEAPRNEIPLTFNGGSTKRVCPQETFWSDEVVLDVPNGAYLVFTWTIVPETDGTVVPCSPDSQIPCFSAEQNGAFTFTLNALKPNLFAVRKSGVKRLGFLGDSITQGCGTENDRYEFWVARIGAALKDRYSTWNLGLGFARAKDAAKKDAWFRKASLCDRVILCLGINEVLNDSDSAPEILRSLREIVQGLKGNNPSIRILIFTLPPPNDGQARLEVWREVNRGIRRELRTQVDEVFDIAAVLGRNSEEDYLSRCGDLHPNGEGGAWVAEAFLTWLATREETVL